MSDTATPPVVKILAFGASRGHGLRTLIGHLAAKLGNVSARTRQKIAVELGQSPYNALHEMPAPFWHELLSREYSLDASHNMPIILQHQRVSYSILNTMLPGNLYRGVDAFARTVDALTHIAGSHRSEGWPILLFVISGTGALDSGGMDDNNNHGSFAAQLVNAAANNADLARDLFARGNDTMPAAAAGFACQVVLGVEGPTKKQQQHRCRIIVAVTHLDCLSTDAERQAAFAALCPAIHRTLEALGFPAQQEAQPATVFIVPVNPVTGENLFPREASSSSSSSQSSNSNNSLLQQEAPEPKLTSWYSGPSIVEAFDILAMHTPTETDLIVQGRAEALAAPLRFVVSGVGSNNIDPVSKRVSTILVCDKVLTGKLSLGDPIEIAPGNARGTVADLRTRHVRQERPTTVTPSSLPPDTPLGFEAKGLKMSDVRAGYVVGHVRDFPPSVVISFTAIVKLFGPDFTAICEKEELIIGTLCSHSVVKVAQIVAQLDPRCKPSSRRRVVVAQSPDCLRSGDVGLVKFVAKSSSPCCIETFDEVPELGVFVLARDYIRAGGLGLGFVETVELPRGIAAQRKWLRRRTALLIREKARSRMGVEAFDVWAVMQRVALFLA